MSFGFIESNHRRIARTCPRCRRKLYHHATLEHYMHNGRRKRIINVMCSDCGYTWNPRFLRFEWVTAITGE